MRFALPPGRVRYDQSYHRPFPGKMTERNSILARDEPDGNRMQVAPCSAKAGTPAPRPRSVCSIASYLLVVLAGSPREPRSQSSKLKAESFCVAFPWQGSVEGGIWPS